MSKGWDAFASREPYFAVLTHPRYLRENFDASAEEAFFHSGEEYVSDLYSIVRARVAPHFAPQSVLEYGCGAGRLVLPFARRAERVTGVDISPAMVATAAEHASRAGVSNVELLTTDAFAGDGRQFDLVNCFLVLQRLRPAKGLQVLRELAGRVREGGVGVFHLPYRTHASRLVSLTRAIRTRVPMANAMINMARHKPASFPFIASNAYDLNEVFQVLQESGFESPHVVYTRHDDLDGVIIHAFRRHRLGTAAPSPGAEETASAAPRDAAFIDVKKLIAESSIEELNKLAEEYFSSLEYWDHHLAKPFARVEDTPQLLINLGVLLQGLDLLPGMTVLEFGSGTGWLSRFLTQLGCRMILLDVSPTALDIARELYRRQPVIGEQPEPSFLVYNGRTIDLPNASVDRILCFDSFHHATNPEDVLREFGRVLKSGGVAGFAEPGPYHSTTAQSQYEMRTYGVIENDIDIHAIWAAAQKYGFTELKLAAFNTPPFHVSLEEYDDLLGAGDTYARWAESTRAYLHNVRDFFMRKAGTERADSRRVDGLRSEIEATVNVGSELRIEATVRNRGRALWLPSGESLGGVALGCHLYDATGHLLRRDYQRAPIPHALEPGDEITLSFTAPLPPPGRYILELDCVAERVTWFSQIGSAGPRVEVVVR